MQLLPAADALLLPLLAPHEHLSRGIVACPTSTCGAHCARALVVPETAATGAQRTKMAADAVRCFRVSKE